MKYFLLLIISGFSILTFSQEKEIIKEIDITYFGREHFLIEGTAIADSLKESPYDRLPISYKKSKSTSMGLIQSICRHNCTISFKLNKYQCKMDCFK